MEILNLIDEYFELNTDEKFMIELIKDSMSIENDLISYFNKQVKITSRIKISIIGIINDETKNRQKELEFINDYIYEKVETCWGFTDFHGFFEGQFGDKIKEFLLKIQIDIKDIDFDDKVNKKLIIISEQPDFNEEYGLYVERYYDYETIRNEISFKNYKGIIFYLARAFEEYISILDAFLEDINKLTIENNLNTHRKKAERYIIKNNVIRLKWNGSKIQLYDIFRQLKNTTSNKNSQPLIANSYTDIAQFIINNFEEFHNSNLRTIIDELERNERPKKNPINLNL